MGTILRTELEFESREAAEFRRYVLAGCRRLDVEELRQLADDIHECARTRRTMRPSRSGVEAGIDATASTVQLSQPRN